MSLTSLKRFLPTPPPRQVVLLPDAHFFVRAVPVTEGALAADVAAQAELAVESLAPFPIGQLYYGHHWLPGAGHALVYAAYRKRFTAEEVEQAVNGEIRQREYVLRGLDAKAVREVEQTYAPIASLNPKKETGQEAVKNVDVIKQWMPSAFVYLLWVSIFAIAQMLLTNIIEEKSNRIIEVLLSSVTPGELMMGSVLASVHWLAAWAQTSRGASPSISKIAMQTSRRVGHHLTL